MKRIVLLSAAILLSINVGAYANQCAVNFTRNACPGKEVESFKKCDGNKSCTKVSEVTSAQECQKVAMKSCANDRLDITKSKVITASFQGKPMKTASGKDDFCAEYANRDKEFNRCQ